MTLDSQSQTFNTGPPQYAASEATVSIEETRPTDSGMEVVITGTNEVLNGGGFFPSYTITVTVGGESKTKETDLFPNQPRELVFPFDTRDSVEVEANPGRNVDSLFLSAPKPQIPDIQEPTLELEPSVQSVTATYSVENEGNGDGSATVEITLTGDNIQSATQTESITVPSGSSAGDSVTFNISNTQDVDVEVCADLQ